MVMLVAVAVIGTAAAQELPLQPYSYVEGFEGEAPNIVLWASRGTPPTIATLAPSTEKAFEGSKSLKIDVTFGDSSYYYFGLPMRVPAAGKLKISARLWVAEGTQNNVGFGVNVVFPPTTESGCGPIQSFREPTGEWKLIEADVVDLGRATADSVMSRYARGVKGKDVAVVLDRWAIFLTGAPGKRVVAYLDDVRIEGEVPEEKAYLAQAKTKFEASRAAFLAEVDAWEARARAGQAAVAASAAHTPQAPKLVAAVEQAGKRSLELVASMRKTVYASPAEAAELEQALAVLEHWPQALATLKEAQAAGRRFILAPCNRAIMTPRRGGDDLLSVITADRGLTASACAGEYEPLSVVAQALQDTPQLMVSCGALTGPAGTIPAGAVDIRVLKSWYQGASTNIGYTKNKWLIPELLLKDDRLVRVDTEKQDNYVRSTGADGSEEYLLCSDPDSANLKGVRPVDSATLKPVDLKAGEGREFWLTIHVPETAKAGTYTGTVSFTSGAGKSELPLTLTVQPFALQPSRLIYSIYYRGVLSADGQPTISSEGKSPEQYRAEIANMKSHGVLYPTNYQSKSDRLTQVLDIRKAEGLPTDAFYNLGYGVGAQTAEQLPELRQQVKWWIDLLKGYGYKDVYFYGIDEATGERLERQKAAWKATQESGGKTYVACYKKTFEAMGALLNTAVLAGPPDPEEGAKYHSVGSQAFCYANPQVGVEDPSVYRRNFGLVLWKAGFDGAMDYAYQHGFGHVWNDFDDKTYRDHNFTYPTVTGVIDTVAWEGFREAVDDVRYVTTLEQAIGKAPAAKKKQAGEAKAWLEALDPATANLDATRVQMCEWIVKLK